MITLTDGQSGYFSKPAQILDPHLFEGEHLRPNVRETINHLLLDYLGRKYNNPGAWTMVWLAGSGISYQWDSDRGNGDLDVLFGLDFNQFVTDNPDYQWSSRGEIADYIDTDMKKNLWPMTSDYMFAYETEHGWWTEQFYELTFFLNQYVENESNSIVNIHPYAAYNLTTDGWTVKPAKQPNTLYPKEYEDAADANLMAAKTLVDRYNAVDKEANNVNKAQHKKLIVQQANNLFDTIHLGRKEAFSNTGEGYGDYYNYAWQRAKRDGIVNALNEILTGE